VRQINPRAIDLLAGAVVRNLAIGDQAAAAAIDQPAFRKCVLHDTISECSPKHDDPARQNAAAPLVSPPYLESVNNCDGIGNPQAPGVILSIQKCPVSSHVTPQDYRLGNADLSRQPVFTFGDQNRVAIAGGIHGLLNRVRGGFPRGVRRRRIRTGLRHIQGRCREFMCACNKKSYKDANSCLTSCLHIVSPFNA